MSYGIQNNGSFDRKHIDTIVADLKTNLENRAGGDIDLEPGSPLKQIVDMIAIEVAEQWEAEEGNYYAGYYEDAFGDQLDGLLALAGISRIPRRGATGQVTFETDSTNASDVTIPQGTEVTTKPTETKPGLPFKTTERVTLVAGTKTVTASVKAKAPFETDVDKKWLGVETNVEANTITAITNPVAGIDRVYNNSKTGDTEQGYTAGRDRETDAELKIRYENTLATSGDATLDAIRSQILNAAQDVHNVKMDENTSTTDNTGSGGLPPKSFRATVYYTGALEDQIAQAILDSRSAGIESYGGTSGVGETDDGDQYTESFGQSTATDIYVDVVATGDGTAPSDAQEKIEDEIIKYIGGTDNTGREFPGTSIGENVLFDQVFAAVMRVSGIQETDVSIGTADNPTGKTNISISDTTVARTDITKIDVTVD